MSYISCAACSARIKLGTVGSHWSVRAPRDVADRLLITMAALEREELQVLLLNAKNFVPDDVTVYVGNVSAALVRVAELFTAAIRRHSAGLLLVHNHRLITGPDLRPSGRCIVAT